MIEMMKKKELMQGGNNGTWVKIKEHLIVDTADSGIVRLVKYMEYLWTTGRK
jgi:hypothetical protein